jgi:curli biogenesis system outer membrane secretion channel CsgG
VIPVKSFFKTNLLKNKTIQMKKYILISITAMALTGCVQEGARTLPIQKVASAGIPTTAVKVPVSVGKFDNRSSFMRGVFSTGEDRMGSQAQTILVTHLQQSQRFSVLDRSVMTEIKQEASLKKQTQTLKGADYVITPSRFWAAVQPSPKHPMTTPT